jgi:uncharacterized protein (TIGR02246 family)
MQRIVEQLTSDWTAAVKAKDAARLASMVTEDCVFLAPNGAPLRGRETVRQLYTSLFGRFDVAQKFHFEEVQSMGDWAFGWGTDDIIMTPVGGGKPVHYAGHGVSILRRDSDNAWRFARGINNATLQDS